jgi:hypothetical protein
MTFDSTVRPPPRRRSARRIAAALCIALFVLPLSAGRAEAYPCSYASGARILSSDCAPPPPKAKKRMAGEPNLVSLALFVAAVVGVLLIPVGYSRQGAGDPE